MLMAKQRRHLRGLAHHLNPVVQIGNAGVTPAVLKQIDGALEAHELIKVKLGKDSPADLAGDIAGVCRELRCQHVQSIGRTWVLLRVRKKDSKIELSPPAAG